MGSFGVLGVPSEYFTILPIFLSMAPPAFFNKYCTVDAMHKMGSFPVPKEGRPVPAMDKITSQELEGAIIVDKTNPRNKYLGFLLDKIFSDFTVDLPSPDELEVSRSAILDVNPDLADSYPDAQKIPLYNTSTRQWNWPISPKAIAQPSEIKAPSPEHHIASFFNAIGQAVASKIGTQSSQRCWMGRYSTRRMPGNVDGAGAYHHKPDIILVEKSDQLADSISWMSPKVLAEHTTQAFKLSMPLVKTIHTKAYLIFLDQPWRRFVLALSIVKQDLRVHFYDHSGASISPAFNIETSPGRLVAILASVMFGSRDSIGFDPTIIVRPTQPLRVSR